MMAKSKCFFKSLYNYTLQKAFPAILSVNTHENYLPLRQLIHINWNTRSLMVLGTPNLLSDSNLHLWAAAFCCKSHLYLDLTPLHAQGKAWLVLCFTMCSRANNLKIPPCFQCQVNKIGNVLSISAVLLYCWLVEFGVPINTESLCAIATEGRCELASPFSANSGLAQDLKLVQKTGCCSPESQWKS